MATYTILNVTQARNAGLPKGREPYGNGAAVVVRDGENPSHGEGRQVDWNGRETWVSVMLKCPSSRDYPGTGEPDAVKAARPVRGEAVGKGP